MNNKLQKEKVVVAMSGGVDSSVAAAVLVEKEYEVIGMMLRLWTEPGMESFNRCCTPEAMGSARKVAAMLDIPFYVLDVREKFRKSIVNYFMDGYAQGITPNPCLMCNRHIRFGTLLAHARSLGAKYLATGHYARLEQDKDGKVKLLRGVDKAKDQSYVLSVLSQEQLKHALFPIGNHPKTEVRKIAEKHNLPVANRMESQDLCFLAGDDYREFLKRHNPDLHNPGPIIGPAGEKIGEHTGLAFYTIGQRKGLGISYREPLYILDKVLHTNTLVATTKSNLGKTQLFAENVSWVSGHPPANPFRAQFKIRYQAKDRWGKATPLPDNCLHVKFEETVNDITPGQAVVIYDGDNCLANGIISRSKI